MPRLAIALNDYWTNEMRTDIWWSAEGLYGCGISLDVWGQLFDFRDGSWYGRIHGPHIDNIDLYSLAQGDRARGTPEPFEYGENERESGNISRILPELPLHALTNAMLFDYGAESPSGIELGSDVRAHVHLHDDFIFRVESLAPGFVAEALRMIVRVHEHYLGIDLLDEEEARLRDRILVVLERERHIDLRSFPSVRCLRIGYSRPRSGWWARLFRLHEEIHETISI